MLELYVPPCTERIGKQVVRNLNVTKPATCCIKIILIINTLVERTFKYFIYNFKIYILLIQWQINLAAARHVTLRSQGLAQGLNVHKNETMDAQ